MRLGVVLASAFVTLSACLDEGSRPEAVKNPASGVEPTDTPQVQSGLAPPLRHFVKTFNLDLTQADQPFGFTSGTNCVRLTPEATLLTGYALGEWQPQTPLTENLKIALHDGQKSIDAAGPSPLRLRFDNVTYKDSIFDAYLFNVEMADPGLAYDQEVSLTLEFDYRGPAQPEAGPSTCSLG